MNRICGHSILNWWFTKYSYYLLPLLFLLSCESHRSAPKYGLFNENDFIESWWEYRKDDYFDDGFGFPGQYEECIMLYRDSIESKVKHTKKSIAYPKLDIHEPYPYVEEILLETDSLKNK